LIDVLEFIRHFSVSEVPVISLLLSIIIPDKPFALADISERILHAMGFILRLWHLPNLDFNDITICSDFFDVINQSKPPGSGLHS
jgi:hypothetical protein